MSLLYLFDYLAFSPYLHIFNQKHFHTKVSIVFSFLFLFTFLGFAIYFFYKFIERSNVNIIYLKETNDFVPSFDPYESVFMVRTLGNFAESEIQLKAQYVYTDSEDLGAYSDELILEQCKYGVHIKEEYKEIMPFNDISLFKCIAPNQTAMITYNKKTHYQSNIFYFMVLCDDNFDEGCKSKEEIEDSVPYVQNLGFSFAVASSIIDHYNHNNPIKPKIESSNYYLSYYNTYEYYNYWDSVIYESDNGILFESYKTEHALQFNFQKTVQMMYQRTLWNDPLGSFSFSVDTLSAEKYYRKYQKLQSVIADIGGILSVLLTIGEIITGFLTESLFYLKLVERVFIVEKKQEIKRSNYITQDINGQCVRNSEVQNSKLSLNVTNFSLSKRDVNNVNINNTYILRKSNSNRQQEEKVISYQKRFLNNKEKINSVNKIGYKLSICDLLFASIGIKINKRFYRYLKSSESIVKQTLSCESIIQTSINSEKCLKMLDLEKNVKSTLIKNLNVYK